MLATTVISIAKICEYLAGNDIARAALWDRKSEQNLDVIIYTERKSVEYIYNNNPNDPLLIAAATYLYALCSGYNQKAQAILSLGTTSGVVSLSPGVSTSVFLVPPDMDGKVGDAGFPVDGASTWQVAQFNGYGIRLRIDEVDQSNLSNTDSGVYFSKPFNSDTLTITGAVFHNGQEIHIEYFLIPSNISTYSLLTQDGSALTID